MTVRIEARRLEQRLAGFVRRQLGAARGDSSSAPIFSPGGSQAAVMRMRQTVAVSFLSGEGLEIGALHQPLQLPAAARVKYVDRMTTSELRRQYEELAAEPLVEIDIIDDGERLATIQDSTQDFVVANHFLEHCQNPILTVQNLFRVLKPGAVLYLAVPDKRFTFDVDRPCTPIEHVLRDFADGPGWSKRGHFDEWSRLVNKRTDEAQVAEEVRRLIEMDYSIHFHVWSAPELAEFVGSLHQFARFELELFARNGFETILVLRKLPA